MQKSRRWKKPLWVMLFSKSSIGNSRCVTDLSIERRLTGFQFDRFKP
jgi:hypothetical protein